MLIIIAFKLYVSILNDCLLNYNKMLLNVKQCTKYKTSWWESVPGLIPNIHRLDNISVNDYLSHPESSAPTYTV